MDICIASFIKRNVENGNSTIDSTLKGTISVLTRDQTLAALWLDVLKHQNNYPPPQFTYEQHYTKQQLDQERQPDKTVLMADDITFTIFHNTGRLILL